MSSAPRSSRPGHGHQQHVRHEVGGHDQARREALGFIDPEDGWTAEAGTAKRILEEAAAEEAHERDVVEGSAREGSALDG